MTRSAGPHKDELTGTWAFVCDLGAGPNGKRRQARRRGSRPSGRRKRRLTGSG